MIEELSTLKEEILICSVIALCEYELEDKVFENEEEYKKALGNLVMDYHIQILKFRRSQNG